MRKFSPLLPCARITRRPSRRLGKDRRQPAGKLLDRGTAAWFLRKAAVNQRGQHRRDAPEMMRGPPARKARVPHAPPCLPILRATLPTSNQVAQRFARQRPQHHQPTISGCVSSWGSGTRGAGATTRWKSTQSSQTVVPTHRHCRSSLQRSYVSSWRPLRKSVTGDGRGQFRRLAPANRR
jgi:hypothetical protein